MLQALSILLVGIYFAAFCYILLYCLLQLSLLIFYSFQSRPPLSTPTPVSQLPFVTIQLPLYNEMYVAERLIDNIMQLDYPKDRLEIQVLDDSTDETVAIVQKKVAEYFALGFQIHHIRRSNRQGYKAGALRDALPKAKGEFVAIFDADFLPRADFLQHTIPYFQDEKVGVIQTRWEHINQNYSLLTQLQAIQLNVHFTIEQNGRQAGGCFLQFNGTAGVWRKQTIWDAGGWEADTLTEDLDLSYRAQLAGYRVVFLQHIGTPAELPAAMNGLKSQQYRWQKGGAESAKKILPTLLQSSISPKQKIHAVGHLMSSSVFVSIFLAGLISVPLMLLLPQLHLDLSIFIIFQAGFLIISLVYLVGNWQVKQESSGWKMIVKFAFLFPIFLAMSMGLSLHNSVAVIQGFRGKRSPFVRTPKFNIVHWADSFQQKKYHQFRLNWITIAEGLAVIYFGFAVVMGLFYGYGGFVPFHAMLALGFLGVFFFSVKDLGLKQ